MKKTRALREKLKKVYALKKATDSSQVGRLKNDLAHALQLQGKLPKDKRDEDVIKRSVEGLAAIAKDHRFCDDFPSFAIFYKYITAHKNGFTVEDIKDL